MVTVNYPLTFVYRDIPGLRLQPAVEVELTNGERNASTVAILDSGATHTVFSVEVAQLLGIDDVTNGMRVDARTLTAPFVFYLFDLQIRLPGDRSFSGQVGFAQGHTPRNILGRILFFSRYEVGFHERQQRINLRPEE